MLFAGQELTQEKPDAIVKAGVSHVPQTAQIFAGLTVQQNLLLGAYVTGARNLWWSASTGKSSISSDSEAAVLRTGRFAKRGEQQMLAIGRGLM